MQKIKEVLFILLTILKCATIEDTQRRHICKNKQD